MVMGTVYINVIADKDLFKQVNHFSPPIMLLFFVLSGMRLNVPMLATAGMIGVGYFFVRIIGKYVGAYARCGCKRGFSRYSQLPRFGAGAAGRCFNWIGGAWAADSACWGGRIAFYHHPGRRGCCMKWLARLQQRRLFFCPTRLRSRRFQGAGSQKKRLPQKKKAG